MTQEEYVRQELRASELALFVLFASGMSTEQLLSNMRCESFVSRISSFGIPAELLERVILRLENIGGKNQGGKGWS